MAQKPISNEDLLKEIKRMCNLLEKGVSTDETSGND